MEALLVEVLTGNDTNMSRVSMEPKLELICANETFASACDRKSQGISLATPILMTTFGVIGNILALIVLYSSRKEAQARRTVFFVMLSGLAWTDLFGQLAVSPIAIMTYANNLTWVGGAHLCRYHGFMMVSFGVVMPLIVCCMSIERFMAIKFSYFYARHITIRKAQLTFLACWCVTTTFTALPFFGLGSYELQFPGSWCFLNFHRESLVDTIYAAMFSSLNIISIIIMILCNLLVTVTLLRMRQSRQLHSSPSVDRRLSISGVGSTTSGTVIRPKHHSDMEAQMIWFLGLITIAFSVCWLPLNVHILIMQFTGTTNMVLDLQFIRMASCNQILDPWLYVIFRKNSLLRIFRRLRACCSKEPQKNGPARPSELRYVMGNKSFMYEPSTVGRTFAGANRVNISPTVCSLLAKQHELQDRLNCNGIGSFNKAKLMSACPPFDDDNSNHSASNPLAGLTPGSPSSEPQDLSYNSDNVPNMNKFQHGSEIVTSKCTAYGTPEPPKKNHCEDLKELDTPGNERADIYYSFDSAQEPFIVSSQMRPTQNYKPAMSTRKTSLLQSFMTSHNSPPVLIRFNEFRPGSLKLSPESHLLLSPPLASPEHLTDTASSTGSRDNLATDTASSTGSRDNLATDTASSTGSRDNLATDTASSTGSRDNLATDTASRDGSRDSLATETPSRDGSRDNLATDTNIVTTCVSPFNIPLKRGDDHISNSPRTTYHSESVSGNAPITEKVYVTFNSEPIKQSSKPRPTEFHVTNGREQSRPNSAATAVRAEQWTNNNCEQLVHKGQTSNGSPTGLNNEERACLLPTRSPSSPSVPELVQLPGKCFPKRSGPGKQSHRDSVSEALVGLCVCPHGRTDHTDHIKCFKAKKTPYSLKSRNADHQTSSLTFNGCGNGVDRVFDSRTKH